MKADVDSSLPHGEFRDNGGDQGDWLTLGPGFLQPLKEVWWVGAGLSAPPPRRTSLAWHFGITLLAGGACRQPYLLASM